MEHIKSEEELVVGHLYSVRSRHGPSYIFKSFQPMEKIGIYEPKKPFLLLDFSDLQLSLVKCSECKILYEGIVGWIRVFWDINIVTKLS